MSRARSRARQFIVQALYQWQMAGQDIVLIEAQFMDNPKILKTEVDYFKTLLHEIPKQINALNELISSVINRPIEGLDPVERGILWLGTFELNHRPEIPYRVVINEGVELAKSFGAEQSHRFVNGVLDKLAHQIRLEEVSRKKKKG